MFSVIIPTLQRSPELWPLVEQCSAHPLVAEVIVINNASEPLSWISPKVRVLQQEKNIFVNPAWNLGAREAKAPWLAIINDDVRFEDEALYESGRALRKRHVGTIGPAGSCFDTTPTKAATHRPVLDIGMRYGTFMCLRKTDYFPIPDDLLIWGGDDWLFWHQRMPNAVLLNTQFFTEMGSTSSSPEFAAWREKERRNTASHITEIKGRRWWHHMAPTYRKLRHWRSKSNSEALATLRNT